MIAEWTQRPWNPVTGCSKVSSGCRYCYAEKLATTTFQRTKSPKYKNGFNVTLHPDLINAPCSWKKPLRIFTCSMSDLFHPDVPNDFLFRVFDTMKRCPQHTFLVLTKRSKRFSELSPKIEWPSNIWMGVTVEDSRCKDRIDDLKTSGAKLKFISAEPLISDLGILDLKGIDWVFVGGESGDAARLMKEEWVLNIKNQCEKQNVMFTFKQWGGRSRKSSGSLLRGEHYHEMPPVIKEGSGDIVKPLF
jgi:protein gp37